MYDFAQDDYDVLLKQKKINFTLTTQQGDRQEKLRNKRNLIKVINNCENEQEYNVIRLFDILKSNDPLSGLRLLYKFLKNKQTCDQVIDFIYNNGLVMGIIQCLQNSQQAVVVITLQILAYLVEYQFIFIQVELIGGIEVIEETLLNTNNLEIIDYSLQALASAYECKYSKKFTELLPKLMKFLMDQKAIECLISLVIYLQISNHPDQVQCLRFVSLRVPELTFNVCSDFVGNPLVTVNIVNCLIEQFDIKNTDHAVAILQFSAKFLTLDNLINVPSLIKMAFTSGNWTSLYYATKLTISYMHTTRQPYMTDQINQRMIKMINKQHGQQCEEIAHSYYREILKIKPCQIIFPEELLKTILKNLNQISLSLIKLLYAHKQIIPYLKEDIMQKIEPFAVYLVRENNILTLFFLYAQSYNKIPIFRTNGVKGGKLHIKLMRLFQKRDTIDSNGGTFQIATKDPNPKTLKRLSRNIKAFVENGSNKYILNVPNTQTAINIQINQIIFMGFFFFSLYIFSYVLYFYFLILFQNNNKMFQMEKMQIKLKYLEDTIENLQKFERTQQLLDLKQFLQKNYKRFTVLLDEIYDLKEQLEEDRKQHYEQILSLQNQVQKQDPFQQIDQHDDQILNLENTIKQLSDEIEELSQSNIRLREQLNKRDFFKEYEQMIREADGLRQQNAKLLEQIKQK
ncbi:hypothetical protein pb186bvf_001335 [Paramecium bursaria]